MRTDDRRRTTCLLAALVLLTGCTPAAQTPRVTTPETPSTPAATSPMVTTTAPTPTARTVNWFDLDIGDCLTDPPPVDPTVIIVAVVDCATPHRAEVFQRAPMAVNTAIADVVDRTCAQGFAEYTGRSANDGTYSSTYLIDSNQNRTSSNPEPSTVICLLEAPGGGLLTQSARR
ncbi:putative lipoprotein LppN [Mycobacterium antarcticum]|uniref:hypothetical protein n=1 Tax=Mycolicibacterium sp. TUM20985 TaxID=3023370 RepID=UPI002572656D|nr:hypothetical protein [Mycolicibacterium sp. TUM20985]BDX33537.1 putative lipoprotein LppN [Mycolicibacterium sp. TUM20985]